jgi:hypothetical protein
MQEYCLKRLQGKITITDLVIPKGLPRKEVSEIYWKAIFVPTWDFWTVTIEKHRITATPEILFLLQ